MNEQQSVNNVDDNERPNKFEGDITEFMQKYGVERASDIKPEYTAEWFGITVDEVIRNDIEYLIIDYMVEDTFGDPDSEEDPYAYLYTLTYWYGKDGAIHYGVIL